MAKKSNITALDDNEAKPKPKPKPKTAVGRITQQTKKQISRIKQASARQAQREALKADQRAAKALSKINEQKHLPRSTLKAMRDQIKAQAREAKKQAKSAAKTAADSQIYFTKQQAQERKATVKRAAKLYAKENDTTFKQAIRRSPKKLEAVAGKQAKKYKLPNKKDFQKIQDEGRLGRGLDYPIPYDYAAYIQVLKAARKTGLFHSYMIYLSSTANIITPLKSALFNISWNESVTLTEEQLREAVQMKYNELVMNYQYKSLVIDGLIVHCTVKTRPRKNEDKK